MSAGYSRSRIVRLMVVGVLLTCCAGLYVHFEFSRPIGSGPAGPSVDSQAFAKPWSDRKVLLLGIGDSITAGLGAKSPDHTFFQRLLENPSDEYPDMEGKCLRAVLPNLDALNIAVSGSNSQQHLTRVTEELPQFDEETFGLVVLTTGGNDLIHAYGRRPPKECAMYGATIEQAKPWIDAFEKRLNELVALIGSRFSGGCEIYLADIYDPTDGTGDAPSIYLPAWPDGLAIHARYNEIIRQCARQHENVHLVPLYETFLGHGSHCTHFWRSTYDREDPHYWYYSNIEDPNDRGYDAIRRVFLNQIVAHSQLSN